MINFEKLFETFNIHDEWFRIGNEAFTDDSNTKFEMDKIQHYFTT